MAIPTFSAWPAIPSRSAPEADFDAKMYAVFQFLAGQYRDEFLAFASFLETNSTVIDGALNDTRIGLTTPADAAFRDLAVTRVGADITPASLLNGTAARFHHGAVGSTGSPNYVAIFSGTAAKAGLTLGDEDDADRARLEYNNSTELIQILLDGTTAISANLDKVNVPAGKLSLGNNLIGGHKITVADDAVATVTPPRKGGFAMITCNGENDFPSQQHSALIYLDVGGSLAIEKVSGGVTTGADLATSTADLTGTTGADGDTTIAVQPGVLKIENRTGAAKSYSITFL